MKTRTTCLTFIVLIIILILSFNVIPTNATNMPSSQSTISPDNIITRAQSWVDEGVSYNSANYVHGYRADCSGFVSFAWQLTDSNGNPESRTTVTLDNISYEISKDDLKPGDILNDNDPGDLGHVIIFDQWVDDEHTEYWGYELEPTGMKHRVIDYPYFGTPTDYVPRRYNNVVNTTPASTAQAAPSTYFLFLPFRTDQGDWLTLMTAAFDHHYPDYTCALGYTSQCMDKGFEIALWESEIAKPITNLSGINLCYSPANSPSQLSLDSMYCGSLSGYKGVTGESIIYYDGHDGYDWAIPGDIVPILAAANGIVTNVWDDGAFGWTVEIDHLNGYKTRYSHLFHDNQNLQNNHNPEINANVSAGDQIGVQGCTGKCTGNHLHFRVFHNGKITDPFGWCYYCTNPTPDPLIIFNGESSQNLWYGNNPRSINPDTHLPDSPSRAGIGIIWDAFNTSYRGGPGEYAPDTGITSTPIPPQVSNIEICDNPFYSAPCYTYQYTDNNFCIYLSNMDNKAESLRFVGTYINNYSAIMYGDSNCQTYNARFDQDTTDFGEGLNNQFSSMRIEQKSSPDTTPPETHIISGPPFCSNNRLITIIASGNDDHSSLDRIMFAFRLDGEAYSGFALNPAAIYTSLSDGSHTVYVKAKDETENEDPSPAQYGFQIDIVPPSTLHTLNGITGNHSWYRSIVTASLSANDIGCGSSSLTTEYNIDGGSWINYTGPITFNTEGIYVLNYHSRDGAGNVETTHSVQIKIDWTPPETTGYAIGPRDMNGIFRDNVQIRLAVTDNLSGKDYSEYNFDGGTTWLQLTGTNDTFFINGSGITLFLYRSVDMAGNAEAIHNSGPIIINMYLIFSDGPGTSLYLLGNTNAIFDGDIHTNCALEAGSNTTVVVSGTVTTVCGGNTQYGNTNATMNLTTGVNTVQMLDYPIQFYQQHATVVFPGTALYIDSTNKILSGTIYAENIILNATQITATVTLVAWQDIIDNTTGGIFQTIDAVNGVVLYAGRDIRIKGTGNCVIGLVYAPNGTIYLDQSTNLCIQGSLMGEQVRIENTTGLRMKYDAAFESGTYTLPLTSMAFSHPEEEMPPLPATPGLVNPVNGKAVQTSFGLIWEEAPSAFGYQVQVATSQTFGEETLIVNVSHLDTYHRVETLFPGQYFWRVRGINRAGYGAWSVTGNFAVATPSPTALPTNTSTPTPTKTPAPTSTATPLPSSTPVSSQTPTPIATKTSTPASTQASSGNTLYLLGGATTTPGTLAFTSGNVAGIDIVASANGQNFDGTPHLPLTYIATGINGTYYSGLSTNFQFFVDAGSNVADGVQARLSYDCTGDGVYDRIEIYNYFATNNLPGWELYSQTRGLKSATGNFCDFANGTVRLDIWAAIGTHPINLRVNASIYDGFQSKLTLPLQPVTVSPTPSFTSTPTPLLTNTPAATPTPTATKTHTPSPTPTWTPTTISSQTPTPTRTPTPTKTPTSTSTQPSIGNKLYLLGGATTTLPGVLAFASGSAAGIDVIPSANGQNFDGTPHSALTYFATGVYGTYDQLWPSGFQFFVDAGSNVADGVQARLSYDCTGDGVYERIETYNYFATNNLPGWELYTQIRGLKSATGSFCNFLNGTVKLEIWAAIGMHPISFRVNASIYDGFQSILTLPLR